MKPSMMWYQFVKFPALSDKQKQALIGFLADPKRNRCYQTTEMTPFATKKGEFESRDSGRTWSVTLRLVTMVHHPLCGEYFKSPSDCDHPVPVSAEQLQALYNALGLYRECRPQVGHLILGIIAHMEGVGVQEGLDPKSQFAGFRARLEVLQQFTDSDFICQLREWRRLRVMPDTLRGNGVELPPEVLEKLQGVLSKIKFSD